MPLKWENFASAFRVEAQGFSPAENIAKYKGL
jgi:hypothetical protein